jgi:hypothetical protein
MCITWQRSIPQDTIKIGFFPPITGPVAADGAIAKQAVELAVKEVNAAGGILGKQVALIVYDDRLNPQEAVAIAHRLIEKDQVIGVVSGSFSGPSRVTAPLFAKARVPMVTGHDVHPDATKGSDSNFRIGFLGEAEVRVPRRDGFPTGPDPDQGGAAGPALRPRLSDTAAWPHRLCPAPLSTMSFPIHGTRERRDGAVLLPGAARRCGAGLLGSADSNI